MVALSFVRGTFQFPCPKDVRMSITNKASRLIKSSYLLLTDPYPFLYSNSIFTLFRWSPLIRILGAEFLLFAAVRLICVTFTYFLTCGRVEIQGV